MGAEWLENLHYPGECAAVYVIMAATEKSQKQHGISAFIVERGTPGLSAIPMKNKFGVRASDTAQITLTTSASPRKTSSAGSMKGLSTR